MGNTTRVLVGGLIAVNLGLVGLLLFRDRSVAPAAARTDAVTAPVSQVERAGGTHFVDAGQSAAAPVAPAAAPVAPAAAPAAAPAEPVAAPAVAVAPAAAVVVAPVAPAEAVAVAPAAPVVPEIRRDPPKAKKTVRRQDPPRREEARYEDREPRRNEPEAVVASRTAPESWRAAEESRREPVRREEPPKPETVTIAAGVNLPIKLDVAIHSRQVKNGDSFEASLASDLVVDGRTIAKAGSEVTGRVIEVIEAGKTKGREQMKLTLTDLTVTGRNYPVEASVASFTADKDTDRDVGIIAGSAAAGAILGAIIKGGKGAAIGAATGAAAGTGVVITTRGRPIELAAGSRLDFTLQQPLKVTLPPASRVPGRDDEPRRDDDEDAAGVAKR